MLRRSGLKRKKPLRTSREKRTGQRNTGPDRSTRELVWTRDEGRCVLCGEGVYERPHSIHHRRNRGSGGSSDPRRNAPSNLLLVCGTGTTGCHGWIGQSPEEARDAGWVVSLNSIEDPAQVPVIHAVFGASVFLADEEPWIRPVAEWGGAA